MSNKKNNKHDSAFLTNTKKQNYEQDINQNNTNNVLSTLIQRLQLNIELLPPTDPSNDNNNPSNDNNCNDHHHQQQQKTTVVVVTPQHKRPQSRGKMLFILCKLQVPIYLLLIKLMVMIPILNQSRWYVVLNNEFCNRTMVLPRFKLPCLKLWSQVSPSQVATWLELWVTSLIKYVLGLMTAMDNGVVL